jgi:hypothetical protein
MRQSQKRKKQDQTDAPSRNEERVRAAVIKWGKEDMRLSKRDCVHIAESVLDLMVFLGGIAKP